MLVDQEFLKAAQLAIAERDLFKAKSEAQLEIIASKDAQINALKGLLDVQKLISKEWQESAVARKAVISIDDKLIAKYDNEIIQLRNDRDQARRANKYWGAGGFVLGAVLAIFAKGNN